MDSRIRLSLDQTLDSCSAHDPHSTSSSEGSWSAQHLCGARALHVEAIRSHCARGCEQQPEQRSSLVPQVHPTPYTHSQQYSNLNLVLQVHHPHAVRFFGACTKRQPYMIVTEYLPGGSLADVFRCRRCTILRDCPIAAPCAVCPLESRSCRDDTGVVRSERHSPQWIVYAVS